jgi:hypothetical protein
VTINGTLIVEGSLIVNGSNVRITAPSGQPALIVAGNISTRANRSMTVNGVTWIGGSIVGEGLLGSLLTTLNFNGALMFGGSGGSQINANAGTIVDIRFDASRVNVPDMDKELARSVTILRWAR